MSKLLQLYEKVGNASYGKAVSDLAPYFGTINPKFSMLRPGACEITIENTRAVQNHLGTMHAIAICNGAELVAGLTTDVSIPEGRRWIPVGMTVNYKAMAKTDIIVTCEGADTDWSALGDIIVPVVARDMSDQIVFEAQITMKISAV